ncbi:MAG: heterodisulfide reductase-related iron-sulfur binding cluster, partial [Candidatus Heimdallarchaeota archaeon]
ELAKIGKEFKGTVEIKHFVDVFKDEVGIDKIKSAITKDLSGLKVACHPGCHYMRPTEWMESDDPLRPVNLRELVAASGATVVDYEELALCCGAAVTNAYEEHGLANLKKKMDSIKNSGADVIVVNCPACFQQLDTRQRDLTKKFETKYNIPVLYLTELYALAMGYSPEELGMKFHRTRLSGVLEKLGL